MQQYTSNGTTAQQFVFYATGSNWKLKMVNDTSKCVDLDGGATGNGTGLVINDCSSSSNSQKWTITPDSQTGSFYFKNVAAGRCIDENGWSTASGLPMQIWDCSYYANQKFFVQAY